MVTPKGLKAAGIRYHVLIQKVGEYVITFPGGIHFGFNMGPNLAEAKNLATPSWMQVALKMEDYCDCCTRYHVEKKDIKDLKEWIEKKEIEDLREWKELGIQCNLIKIQKPGPSASKKTRLRQPSREVNDRLVAWRREMKEELKEKMGWEIYGISSIPLIRYRISGRKYLGEDKKNRLNYIVNYVILGEPKKKMKMESVLISIISSLHTMTSLSQ
jgi:hypothetical protein